MDVAEEEAEALLHIIDVVSANGEFAVGHLIKLCRGNDHRFELVPAPDNGGRERNLTTNSEIENRNPQLRPVAGNITLTDVP